MTKYRHDYLYQRPGSLNWWIRFQGPSGAKRQSLGTSDRRQAEILALPLIAEHKAALLAARPRLEATWERRYSPGLHVGPDGGQIFATDSELHFLDASGQVARREPNGRPAYQLVGEGRVAVRSLADAYAEGFGEARPAKRSDDDAVLETYIKHAGLGGYIEREARAVWELYQSLVGKPLKDATRDDGRKLVAHFESQGLKSATIEKKIAWLNAAVNLAIDEGRLKFNPFAKIVPRRDDKLVRLPLDEADMKAIRARLSGLAERAQLLLRLLATTGMRLSEAFEIDRELTERGVRYVIVGSKTPQSKRRVPLPGAVLPFLPKTIRGPLFASKHADPSDAASKRLNRFLREIGISDPRKVIHSLRHRAADRLRAAGCPEDIRWALLGHEEKTVAAGYGEGFPVPLLRKWIDKIGF